MATSKFDNKIDKGTPTHEEECATKEIIAKGQEPNENQLRTVGDGDLAGALIKKLTIATDTKKDRPKAKCRLPTRMVTLIKDLGWDVSDQLYLGKWTAGENKNFQRIAVLKRMKTWEDVAKALNTGRTAYQCFVYMKIKGLRRKNAKPTWSVEERSILEGVVPLLTKDNHVAWGRVAASFVNRTKLQCYTEYQIILEHKRLGKFLAEEDAVILSFVKSFGERFDVLAEILVGRSSEQLENRYSLLVRLQYDATWTTLEDSHLLYVMAHWPLTNAQTFMDVAESAAIANEKCLQGRDIKSIVARFASLVSWKKTSCDWNLTNALRRTVWPQIKPKDELIMNFCLAIGSLAAQLQFELVSFQEANWRKKPNTKMNPRPQQLENMAKCPLAE